jgi:hypothetical protein
MGTTFALLRESGKIPVDIAWFTMMVRGIIKNGERAFKSLGVTISYPQLDTDFNCAIILSMSDSETFCRTKRDVTLPLK